MRGDSRFASTCPIDQLKSAAFRRDDSSMRISMLGDLSAVTIGGQVFRFPFVMDLPVLIRPEASSGWHPGRIRPDGTLSALVRSGSGLLRHETWPPEAIAEGAVAVKLRPDQIPSWVRRRFELDAGARLSATA